jgi:hypothetical protein
MPQKPTLEVIRSKLGRAAISQLQVLRSGDSPTVHLALPATSFQATSRLGVILLKALVGVSEAARCPLEGMKVNSSTRLPRAGFKLDGLACWSWCYGRHHYE